MRRLGAIIAGGKALRFGGDKAAALLATTHGISVSAVSYMELVPHAQPARMEELAS